MKHSSPEELLEIAEIKPAIALTRRERLDRWAELLERDPAARLRTFEGIEWQPKAIRESMRVDGSPLTIAYNDPVLRAAGLKSDKLGDVMRFFELSEQRVHQVVCYCMHGRSVEGRAAASAVRAVSAGPFLYLLPIAVFAAVILPTVCLLAMLT